MSKNKAQEYLHNYKNTQHLTVEFRTFHSNPIKEITKHTKWKTGNLS